MWQYSGPVAYIFREVITYGKEAKKESCNEERKKKIPKICKEWR